MEKDTRLIFIETIEPFITSDCYSRITANIDIIEQRLAANGYMGHLIQKLQKALELACVDIADDDCPYEFDLDDEIKCHNCSHLIENHVDTQRDLECWKKYYLKKALQDAD